MWYLVSFIFLLILYILGIVVIKNINKNKTIDILIPIIVFILYLVCVLYMYNKVGLNDWNFLNVLPTANVSPFMFFGVVVIFFIPDCIKKYVNTLISFLSLGMFCAGMINLIFNAIRDYNFYLNFVLDSLIHMLFSLYGIYLFKTRQVCVEKYKQVISGLIIIVVAVIMLILNLIFKTSFFGLSLYGDHNIYNVVLCKSSVLSAIVYFSGLMLVLIFGFIYQKLLFARYINKNMA